MIKFDDVTGKNIKERNPNQPQIPNHSYKMLIIGGWRLEVHKLYIDKIYLYAKIHMKQNINF